MTQNECPYYIEHGDCYDCVYYGDGDDDWSGEDCPFEDAPNREVIIEEMKKLATKYYISLFEEVPKEDHDLYRIKVIFYDWKESTCIMALLFDLTKIRGNWRDATREALYDRLVKLGLVHKILEVDPDNMEKLYKKGENNE